MQVSEELDKMRSELSATTHANLSSYASRDRADADADAEEIRLTAEHAALHGRIAHTTYAINNMKGVLKLVMRPSPKPTQIMSTARIIFRQAPSSSTASDTARHSFRCSHDKCAGFVVSGKCGMCNAEFCSSCEIAVSKGGGHRCTEDDLESVRAIKASTKQCPWPGCGVRIQRSEGCNDMWCTKCNRAFDYLSGKPIQGAIHNPHYSEYAAASDASEAQRRDIVELPANAPVEMRTALRLINMFLDVTEPRAEATFAASQLRSRELMACMYLNNEMDDAKFKARCFLIDKDRRFFHGQQQMVQAACYCALDCIDASDAASQLERLRKHFNESLNGLSERFNRQVYHIADNWSIIKQGGGKRGRHSGRDDDEGADDEGADDEGDDDVGAED